MNEKTVVTAEVDVETLDAEGNPIRTEAEETFVSDSADEPTRVVI